jgi:hypothetical protein
MSLTPGSRLGPYEILSAIGAGGMGEVYRAKDPRLGRDVAIKVLPSSLSADADRLRRFEQEARAAGVLNHPNLTAVYDVGTHEGAPYVVQELLEGETLRARLAGDAFTPRRAIGHALQIAQGLAAAHAKGIVHRDLKPENIFVTNDGRVKILDFGLAKLTETEAPGANQTSLPTQSRGTEPGVVMGTLGYMSPEQVRGKPADPRSDIFSFGAVLYEMLSGKRAFHGDTAADTMSAILTREPPDLSETNRRVPESLDRIVRHCLEKSPEARFQSASDIAFDLEAISEAPLASGPQAAVRSRARRLLIPIAAALAIAAAAGAGYFLRRSPGPGVVSFKRLTFQRGNIAGARFTPDGAAIVYSASWDGRPLEVFTARLDSVESTPLGYRGADVLSVSRSGELALSVRERFLGGPFGPGTLSRAPLAGGVPRQMAEGIEFADWSAAGKDLAVTRMSQGRFQLEYPIGKVLYASARNIGMPRFSRDGSRIAFLVGFPVSTDVGITDLSGKVEMIHEAEPVARLAWSPLGNEVWYDTTLESGELALVANNLRGRRRVLFRSPDPLIVHDVSPDGRALVERYNPELRTMCRHNAAGSELDLGWFDISFPVAISADGERLLLQVVGSLRDASFYLRRTNGEPPVKLGNGGAFDLTTDGQWVLAAGSDVAGGLALVPTGTGSEVAIARKGLEVGLVGKFLPGTRRIVIPLRDPKTNETRIYLVDGPTGVPTPLTPPDYVMKGQPVSHDGRWIVVSRNYEEEDLSVFPIGQGERRTVPNSRGLEPIDWHPDGKSIFVGERGSIPLRVLQLDLATGRRVPWRELGPPSLSGVIAIGFVVMTPGGAGYAYAYNRASASDLFLVEGLR